MPSPNSVEHFVTLFDSKFLPMGMALHESLMTHAQPFHLWIVCMDEKVEGDLRRIALPHVTLLPLCDVENEKLLAVKPGRSRVEYCWTMTPFTFQAVFDRDRNVERVTYLDSDLFFFAPPQILLDELAATGKQVLITDHAYDPEYNQQPLSGRFCVQFLTFNNTTEAAKVMHWWQDRCLEWCFDRLEDGKFGDQKYLDCWPELFANEVHIAQQVEKTLAPWNVQYFERKSDGKLAPVFYHFHGLRIRTQHKIRLYDTYKIGKKGLSLYETYLVSLQDKLEKLTESGIPIPILKDNSKLLDRVYRMIMRMNHYKRLVYSWEK